MTSRLSRRTALALGAGALVLSRLAPAGAAGLPETVAALPDITLGPADAKVSIVEYAAVTCSHCAHFHATSWPALKSKYVEAGKVRFALRGFPLNILDVAGFMCARAAGPERYYPTLDLLFSRQQEWAFVDRPLPALQKLLIESGFSQEKFLATLQDQALSDAVMEAGDLAEKAGVSATPTFFINGAMHQGALSVDDLDKILGPLVGGG